MENSAKIIKDMTDEYTENETTFKDLLLKCIKISEWLFKPQDKATAKKATSEEEKKQLDKLYDQQYYQNEEVLSILQQEVFDCKEKTNFKSNFFAF